MSLGSASRAEIKISLLTTSPGTEVHTLFGHSVLRVINTDTGFDKLYNYGLFDFKTPFFPFRLLKGDLDYWLGRQNLPRFIEINNKEKRTITEQELNLNQNQALRIFKHLEENAKSENKFYRYSFTQRNCSTEIRDILLAQSLIGSRETYSTTYRELMNEYLVRDYWIKFGMNLLLGSMVEEEMTFEEQLFMPDNLLKAVGSAPGLVSKTNQLNQDFPNIGFSLFNFALSPLIIFTVLAIIVFFWSPKWLRLLIYFTFGCLGVLIAYFWLVTLHPELMNNYNLLWCNPLYLLMIPIILLKLNPKVLVYTCWAFLILALAVWMTHIQTFDYQIMPVVPMMGILLFKELNGYKKTPV